MRSTSRRELLTTWQGKSTSELMKRRNSMRPSSRASFLLGKVIDSRGMRFALPSVWRYDVLRAQRVLDWYGN